MTDALREAEMLAFEDWMRRDSTLPLDRDSFDYADFHVAVMWHAWEARAALAAPAVPPGWQMVPVEPTPEMQWAGVTGLDAASHSDIDPTLEEVAACYRAMLAAAPGAPDAREGEPCKN